SQPVDGELWVVSGTPPVDLPSSARLLATSPTLTSAERRGQLRGFESILAEVRANGVDAGPRPATTSADEARVKAALAAPEAALSSGDLARLASQGLVHAPGGDLARLVAVARLRTLAQEGRVQVYLVQRS
ncbi:MAG: hypothetical protein ABIP03_05240, partial [Aquihabitans sp.]